MLKSYLPKTLFTFKWLAIAVIVGTLTGLASALFLVSLDWVTNFREKNTFLIYFLPLAGVAVAAMYHYFGQDVVKGNNQLIEEVEDPQNTIPLKMAPFVLIGTLLTHLFGGSAGREGTAVQMGGAIADQLSEIIKFSKANRRILIITGISGGFASVFGTPLAGAVFALEVLVIGQIRYEALVPALLSALIANYVCEVIPWVHHTHYVIGKIPDFNALTLVYAIVAGMIFGLASRGFSEGIHFTTSLFNRLPHPLIKPLIGGAVIVAFFYFTNDTRLLGLGIPTIVNSFSTEQPFWMFAAKILLTIITLSSGFKGGEVTPLFFIGATLGSALAIVLPLPVGLLAGMGFVALFAGAANTPIACLLMGIELFGANGGIYLAIAITIAYLFSGNKGIYSSQKLSTHKLTK